MAVKRALPRGSAQALKPVKRLRTHQPSHPADLNQRVKIFVCGEGTAGELGLGNVRGAVQAKTPKPNPLLQDIVTLVAGGMHCVALDVNGRVLTWGGNDLCALGRPTPEDDDEEEPPGAPGLNSKEATPTALDTISAGTVVQVAAGDNCSFALTTDGLVYGWGTFRDHNSNHKFTFDPVAQTHEEFRKTPTQVPQLQDIVQIAAGVDFALALDASGRVWGWGPNEQSETGHRFNPRSRNHHQPHPDEVLLPQRTALSRPDIVSIHAGTYHAFAIDKSGRTYAWGLNNFGQTGIARGAGSDSPIIYPPQKVQSLAGYKMSTIVGGAHHSVGLTADGVVLVWGRVDGSQTGLDVATFADMPSGSVIFDESSRPRILLKPTALPIPRCVAIAAGTDHSIAVAESGRVFSWGFNDSAQCGHGTDTDITVAQEIKAASIADEHVVAAIAGGQFSMVAARIASSQ